MVMYEIVFSEKALQDILRLRKSRAITKKHRLIYEIVNNEVRVDVLSAYGHYDDK